MKQCSISNYYFTVIMCILKLLKIIIFNIAKKNRLTKIFTTGIVN